VSEELTQESLRELLDYDAATGSNGGQARAPSHQTLALGNDLRHCLGGLIPCQLPAARKAKRKRGCEPPLPSGRASDFDPSGSVASIAVKAFQAAVIRPFRWP
jgi:hypothetical protein